MYKRNGTPPAPHTASGAFAYQKQRTEFLPELPVNSARAVLYHLSREQLAGFSVLRWLLVLVGVTGLLSPLIGLPGGWWLTGLAALAIVVVLWLVRRIQAQCFIKFEPLPAAKIMPAALPAVAKIPVYVAGWLTVQNKARQFAGVPGFYRTFATREHALLCQVRPRRFGLLVAWPSEEEGLWYTFFKASEIGTVRARPRYFWTYGYARTGH